MIGRNARGTRSSYSIGFAIRGNAESKPPTQAGLKAFRSVTDLQVSPHSLPAFALGKNTVHFWNQSPGAIKVRITHRWREFAGPRPPARVEAAVSPADGAEVDSLAPALKWLPADQAIDYQVMVSLRPDCRWPLSPTLHQNVGSNATEWKLPASFLNTGTDYYWKVRARDNHGNTGEWSRAFRFTTAAQAK